MGAPIKQPAEAKTQPEDFFGLQQSFESYVSKLEITNLAPNFLVKGSKNVLLDYALRIISRPGYALYNQANTGGGGIKSSYEWDTSTGKQFSLRGYDATLEFDWNGAYNTLMSGLPTAEMEFTQVNDFDEQQDVLLFVKNDPNVWRWSGGVSKVWQMLGGGTQLLKQGVLAATNLGTTTISHATPAVISLAAHGLVAGDIVMFTTSGTLPSPLTVGTPYYVIAAGLSTDSFEVALTAGGAAINSTTDGSGVHNLWRATRSAGITFVAGIPGSVAATILDSNANFLNAGFAAGDTLYVSGSASNSRNFTIGSVTAGVITLIMSNTLVTESTPQLVVLHNGEPTWKSSRFFNSISDRAITYEGVSYAYSGGETTDTLMGLTAFPSVSVGDPVWQTVDSFALPSSITSAYPQFTPDIIASQLNAIFLASSKASVVFGSSVSDYTDFTLTDPRAQGDPMQMPLTNGFCSCIIPTDTDKAVLNIQSTLIFGSGRDAFDQIDFHMSADNSEELARIIRYMTAKGVGLISKDAYCPIKGNTVYISREPALTSLSEAGLEQQDGSKNTPISDPIKDDFDAYDFTGAHMTYWKRALWIALPAEGLVLIYDLMRGLWQPPMTMPIARLAIINDWLYGHSAITNETYKLWTGTDDNGIYIPQVARFAYNNGGRRDRLKNMSEHWSDGYITANGDLNVNLYYGFEGATGIKTFPVSGGDTSIVTGLVGSPLGSEPLGVEPLGGATLGSPSGLEGQPQLLRFQQIDTVSMLDYFEYFVEYTMNTLGGQFAIVAHGSDQWDAGTSPVSHKK